MAENDVNYYRGAWSLAVATATATDGTQNDPLGVAGAYRQREVVTYRGATYIYIGAVDGSIDEPTTLGTWDKIADAAEDVDIRDLLAGINRQTTFTYSAVSDFAVHAESSLDNINSLGLHLVTTGGSFTTGTDYYLFNSGTVDTSQAVGDDADVIIRPTGYTRNVGSGRTFREFRIIKGRSTLISRLTSGTPAAAGSSTYIITTAGAGNSLLNNVYTRSTTSTLEYLSQTADGTLEFRSVSSEITVDPTGPLTLSNGELDIDDRRLIIPWHPTRPFRPGAVVDVVANGHISFWRNTHTGNLSGASQAPEVPISEVSAYDNSVSYPPGSYVRATPSGGSETIYFLTGTSTTVGSNPTAGTPWVALTADNRWQREYTEVRPEDLLGATQIGRDILVAADGPAVRTLIGAGTGGGGSSITFEDDDASETERDLSAITFENSGNTLRLSDGTNTRDLGVYVPNAAANSLTKTANGATTTAQIPVVTGGSVSGTTLTLTRNGPASDLSITGLPSGGGGGGISEFVDNTAYDSGSIVRHDNSLWVAQQAIPSSNTPNPGERSTYQTATSGLTIDTSTGDITIPLADNVTFRGLDEELFRVVWTDITAGGGVNAITYTGYIYGDDIITNDARTTVTIPYLRLFTLEADTNILTNEHPYLISDIPTMAGNIGSITLEDEGSQFWVETSYLRDNHLRDINQIASDQIDRRNLPIVEHLGLDILPQPATPSATDPATIFETSSVESGITVDIRNGVGFAIIDLTDDGADAYEQWVAVNGTPVGNPYYLHIGDNLDVNLLLTVDHTFQAQREFIVARFVNPVSDLPTSYFTDSGRNVIANATFNRQIRIAENNDSGYGRFSIRDGKPIITVDDGPLENFVVNSQEVWTERFGRHIELEGSQIVHGIEDGTSVDFRVNPIIHEMSVEPAEFSPLLDAGISGEYVILGRHAPSAPSNSFFLLSFFRGSYSAFEQIGILAARGENGQRANPRWPRTQRGISTFINNADGNANLRPENDPSSDATYGTNDDDYAQVRFANFTGRTVTIDGRAYPNGSFITGPVGVMRVGALNSSDTAFSTSSFDRSAIRFRSANAPAIDPDTGLAIAGTDIALTTLAGLNQGIRLYIQTRREVTHAATRLFGGSREESNVPSGLTVFNAPAGEFQGDTGSVVTVQGGESIPVNSSIGSSIIVPGTPSTLAVPTTSFTTLMSAPNVLTTAEYPMPWVVRQITTPGGPIWANVNNTGNTQTVGVELWRNFRRGGTETANNSTRAGFLLTLAATPDSTGNIPGGGDRLNMAELGDTSTLSQTIGIGDTLRIVESPTSGAAGAGGNNPNNVPTLDDYESMADHRIVMGPTTVVSIDNDGTGTAFAWLRFDATGGAQTNVYTNAQAPFNTAPATTASAGGGLNMDTSVDDVRPNSGGSATSASGRRWVIQKQTGTSMGGTTDITQTIQHSGLYTLRQTTGGDTNGIWVRQATI